MQVYLDESGSIVNGLAVNASKSVPYFVLAALVLREDLSIKTHLRQIKTKTLAIKHMFFEVCSTSLPHRLISSSHSVPSSYN